MALTMNEESKNLELKKLLLEHEKYKATTWGTIVFCTPKLLSYAVDTEKRPKIGTSSIYCYIGLTQANLNIVTLHSLDVTRVTGTFRIPLKDIQQAFVKNGVLKSSITIDFGNEKCKLERIIHRYYH